jgi:hypothetical protein
MATDREQDAIRSHLLDYANEIDSRILAARDYGSRARGLDDPESDYDVMFVFAQPPAEYAIGAYTETYDRKIEPDESHLDSEIELHGWNLRKFVGNDGIGGSNPTAMGFVLSDEIYVEPSMTIADDFESMLDHARREFKPYALINHYRSLAASNYGKYIEQSWVREWSQEQFKQYTGKPGGQSSVDEERGVLTVGIMGYDEHTVEIPLQEAKAEGMIRRTTRDPTVKRHLNVAQALLRARFVEETHELPTPMGFNEFLRKIADAHWLSEEIYAIVGDLIALKVNGRGEETYDDETFDEWVENELSRSIEPENHVDRDTDWYEIRSHARSIYEDLDFE